ncbi:septum formation initiator [Streptomyces sp. NPDC059783]|uniref:FtsB family cell division protein n=1 Tax=Streptomyces sp. NPDC059783 TaxID=3346944 RepID=UPI00364AEE87
MSTPAGRLKGRAARLGRLMPAGPSKAARTPFVLLVVVLLGGGLISLLLLNSALNEGSFRLSELRKRTTELTDDQQALQRDVDRASEPDALARRARELGMVPGGSPVFLGPDGKVRGVPSTATAEPTPAAPKPSPSEPVSQAAPQASGQPRPTPAPSASASGAPVTPGASASPRTTAVPPSPSPGR